jgi:hypothetical protein
MLSFLSISKVHSNRYSRYIRVVQAPYMSANIRENAAFGNINLFLTPDAWGEPKNDYICLIICMAWFVGSSRGPKGFDLSLGPH